MSAADVRNAGERKFLSSHEIENCSYVSESVPCCFLSLIILSSADMYVPFPKHLTKEEYQVLPDVDDMAVWLDTLSEIDLDPDQLRSTLQVILILKISGQKI